MVAEAPAARLFTVLSCVFQRTMNGVVTLAVPMLEMLTVASKRFSHMPPTRSEPMLLTLRSGRLAAVGVIGVLVAVFVAVAVLVAVTTELVGVLVGTGEPPGSVPQARLPLR